MKKGILLLTVVSMTVLFTTYSCSSINHGKDKQMMSRVESSAQYHNGKFANPIEWDGPMSSNVFSTTWDFLFLDNNRKPKWELPRVQIDPNSVNHNDSTELAVTWLGHSSLLISVDGYKLLTDPVFEKSVSIVGPTRYNGDIPLQIAQLPDIDVVVISHDHYDHLNKS